MSTATANPSAKQDNRIVVKSILESGKLPIEDLARLAAREGKRPRPIYGAHKWFARRAGSSFRALLVASTVSNEDDFWQGFYGETDLGGMTILDPFVGGGTSVVEARRLGATAIGVDIDSIACAVTEFEISADLAADPDPTLHAIRVEVKPLVSRFYETTLPDGEKREVLHFFWVQVISCARCESEVEVHPHHRLAYQSDGTRQWAFCPRCHEPEGLPKWFKTFTCKSCSTHVSIEKGNEARGRVTCVDCGNQERLIDVTKRTGNAPAWKLFAIESIPRERPGAGRVNLAQRKFSAATESDRVLYEQASAQLSKSGKSQLNELDDFIPTTNRSDDRLINYGYSRYRDLFNDRQLLHLTSLFASIDALPTEQKKAAALAFSDHLTKNCMQTCYAVGWRRLVPLFAFRAFRHIPRPVEINPWLDGVGRGTFPNAMRQVGRAIDAAKHPTELLRDGGEIRVPSVAKASARIINATAQMIPIESATVDLILTDPPYFDNIDYSELADFYRPWLSRLGMLTSSTDLAGIENSLAAKDRGKSSAEHFADQLSAVAEELDRVLTTAGRVVFTFRHNTERGWKALGDGIESSGAFRCAQVFPLLAEGANALHTREQSGVFDAVFVLERGTPACTYDEVDQRRMLRSSEHAKVWREQLEELDLPVPFRDQDDKNFQFACRVAASLGAFE